ncbi:hypothetical protein BSKO_10207 [Bryopsis sp. KO-2023]|nr:hypothetical protein BSKO_10207 [Bryopsis sp. KO-2023]
MSLIRGLLGSFVGAVLANNPGVVFFLAGTVTGVYVEQAYKLPDLEEQVKMYIDKLKNLEQDLKKDK